MKATTRLNATTWEIDGGSSEAAPVVMEWIHLRVQRALEEGNLREVLPEIESAHEWVRRSVVQHIAVRQTSDIDEATATVLQAGPISLAARQRLRALGDVDDSEWREWADVDHALLAIGYLRTASTLGGDTVPVITTPGLCIIAAMNTLMSHGHCPFCTEGNLKSALLDVFECPNGHTFKFSGDFNA